LRIQSSGMCQCREAVSVLRGDLWRRHATGEQATGAVLQYAVRGPRRDIELLSAAVRRQRKQERVDNPVEKPSGRKGLQINRAGNKDLLGIAAGRNLEVSAAAQIAQGSPHLQLQAA